jgi:hypothetical protein
MLIFVASNRVFLTLHHALNVLHASVGDLDGVPASPLRPSGCDLDRVPFRAPWCLCLKLMGWVGARGESITGYGRHYGGTFIEWKMR